MCVCVCVCVKHREELNVVNTMECSENYTVQCQYYTHTAHVYASRHKNNNIHVSYNYYHVIYQVTY